MRIFSFSFFNFAYLYVCTWVYSCVFLSDLTNWRTRMIKYTLFSNSPPPLSKRSKVQILHATFKVKYKNSRLPWKWDQKWMFSYKIFIAARLNKVVVHFYTRIQFTYIEVTSLFLQVTHNSLSLTLQYIALVSTLHFALWIEFSSILRIIQRRLFPCIPQWMHTFV